MTLGILCPGQGSQHAGMIDLLQGDERAMQILELAEPVLGTSVRALLTDHTDSIFQNVVAQPLLCAVLLATWRALEPMLPCPGAIAGYSVGELAAYGCADAIEAADLIRIAAARARFMDDACAEPSRMAAVRGLRLPDIKKLADESGVYLAIVNEHDHVVIGGLQEPMSRFENAARASGALVTVLNISVASHTPLMMPAVARFSEILAQSAIARPSMIVLSPIDGRAVLSADAVVPSLLAQLHTTLNWRECMLSLLERGCRAVLEIGPGDSLTRMCRRLLPDLPARSVSEFRTLVGVAAWVNRVLES